MYVDDLAAAHEHLANRYAGLKAARGENSVFAIEHGLTPKETESLVASVGEGVRRWGFYRNRWDQVCLPLLAVASEVGYRYRGTGTEFWPKFESFAGVELPVADREKLTAMFSYASKRWGLKKPADTSWTRLYRHIAWPIANALAPLEIHRPLAMAMRNLLRSRGTYAGDDLLLTELREISAGLWSNRLHDWLLDGDVAIEVFRSFLGQNDRGSWLSADFLSRLASDLRRDEPARVAVAEAADIARIKVPTGATLPSRARYSLVLSEGKVTQLLLHGPVTPAQVHARIVQNIDRRAGWLQISGGSQPLLLDEFLSGRQIKIGNGQTVPPRNLLTFSSYDAREAGPEVAEYLSALQPVFPNLFTVGNDGVTAFPVIDGEVLEPTARYVRLRAEDGEPTEAWSKCEIVYFTASSEDDRRRLERLGYKFRDQGDVKIIGPCILSTVDGALLIPDGEPLLIVAVADDVRLALRSNDADIDSTRLTNGHLVALNLKSGEYHLRITTDTISRLVSLQVGKTGQEEPFSVELSPTDATVNDFLAGDIALSIKAIMPLDHVNISATVSTREALIASAHVRTDNIPALIGGGSHLFSTLREGISSLSDTARLPLRLHIDIEGLGAWRWEIPWRAGTYVYKESEATWIDATGEAVGSSYATSVQPLLAPLSAGLEKQETIFLRLPASLSADRFLSVECVGPSVWRPGAEEGSLPTTLLRQTETRHNALGLRSVVESYLAWSLAKGDNILTMRGARAIAGKLEYAAVKQLCGTEWAANEAKFSADSSSDAEVLIQICREQRLVENNECPVLTGADDFVFQTELRLRFASVLSMIDDLASDPDALANSCDMAVNDAYETVRRNHIKNGRDTFDEPDIGYPAEVWLAVLAEAKARRTLANLSRFILPASRWTRLSLFDFGRASEDEVVDALHASHVDVSRGSRPPLLSRSDLKLGLQLWLAPRHLVTTSEWFDAIARTLSDRQTSRAIRYAALRTRIARRSDIQLDAAQ